MMDTGLVQKAKEIIENIIYINLATVNANGDPWNNPVFFAYDKNYNFYWRTGKDAIHSQNINANGKVFMSIYNSRADWGTGQGVFIQAKAVELTEKKEVAEALSLLDNRSPKTSGTADTFMDDYPRRIYKAIPEKVWMNVDGKINRIFVDKRVEIKLI